MSDMPDADDYALVADDLERVDAPDLPYKPPMPRAYRPRIGLIGAGGIAGAHLDAYRGAGWDVATICNRTLSRAQARVDEFFPDAKATDRIEDVLSDASIDVVDITPHPADRLPLIKAALNAGKHVLSQKPFVLDLDEGERLCVMAEDADRLLAVNQNGRWSPHMAWMREATRRGMIGEIISANVAIHWDHNWVAGTPFDQIDDLILYDFGIHWFDFITSLLSEKPISVYASAVKANGQTANVPLLAQALVRLNEGQASLVFDGASSHGPRDLTYIAGAKGSLRSEGPDLGRQQVTLTRGKTFAVPQLEGTWFNDGFAGAMGELLCAIEEDRQPSHNGRENLDSLALAFAAITSRRERREVDVGSVRAITI